MISIVKKFFLVLFAAFSLTLVMLSTIFLTSDDRNPNADPEDRVYIKIAPGMDARSIGQMIVNKGVIDNRLKFILLAKINGYEDKFKVGVFDLYKGMGTQAALDRLISGDVVSMKFTIPEGFTVKDIAHRLNDLEIANESEFLLAAKNYAPYDYIEKKPNVIFRAEGFLFPDTYTVATDIDVDTILEMMSTDLDMRLDDQIRAQLKEKNLSIYDLITLASLVEKEAKFDEDRSIIAQVFFKRLELGMPLQTDATLQYLMDAPKEDVLISDTEIDSPYNTYQHAGLPPGPIANPGMESIEAVLNPATTDYLYFVADREGKNYYSYTYEEHLARVNEVR